MFFVVWSFFGYRFIQIQEYARDNGVGRQLRRRRASGQAGGRFVLAGGDFDRVDPPFGDAMLLLLQQREQFGFLGGGRPA